MTLYVVIINNKKKKEFVNSTYFLMFENELLIIYEDMVNRIIANVHHRLYIFTLVRYHCIFLEFKIRVNGI